MMLDMTAQLAPVFWIMVGLLVISTVWILSQVWHH